MELSASSLPMMAVQSVGAVILAAILGGPAGSPTRAAAPAPVQTTAIYVARIAPPQGERVYDSAPAICRLLRGGATGVHFSAARLPAGTPVAVLRVADTPCDDRTVPVARVRVTQPGSPLDGQTGYVTRGGLETASMADTF